MRLVNYYDNQTGLNYACLFNRTHACFTIATITVTAIVALFGNSMILMSLCKFSHQFKGSMYLLIGNLAVADLLILPALVMILLDVTLEDLTKNWEFCVSKFVVVLFTYIASVLTFTALSIDRLLAVYFPLRYHVLTRKKYMHMIKIAIVWLLSMAYTYMTYSYLERPDDDQVYCRISILVPLSFDSNLNLTVLSIQFVNLTLCSSVIWKMKRRNVPNATGRMRTTSKKTIVTFIALILFNVSWMPFTVSTLVSQYVPQVKQEVVCMREYFGRLGLINSCVDWIIYGIANAKFRNAFKKILKFDP